MRTSFFLILIINLLSIGNINSQISTDRPDQTESPSALEINQIQIETGIAIEDYQSNINTLFRFGIINGIEIRLNSNYIINDKISNLKKSSFTDFEVGAKFNILNKERITKMGLLTTLSIPTAPEIFSNNDYGLLASLLISHDLQNESQIGYNVGYNRFNNLKGELIYSLVYSKALDSFTVFFEVFGNDSEVDTALNFDSGLSYLFDKNKQLDLSIGKGINNSLFFVSFGYSVNIQ
tara:strand:- start:1887 stop:2594 length:708 start_codon:yes stop_codon:yes gene_type:complete